MTHKDYENGKWRNKNLTEEELFETTSPEIFNLVKRVEIRNLTSQFSDAYDEITYNIRKDLDFRTLGIEFSRKDYYVTLKTYCLSLK